jgi:hypothetical protein
MWSNAHQLANSSPQNFKHCRRHLGKGLYRYFMMLTLNLAVFLLPLLFWTTTASIVGNPHGRDLNFVYAKDSEIGNGNSVRRWNGMVPLSHFILI